MKECEKCSRMVYSIWSNFCTKCGSELVELKQDYHFCPNPECNRYSGEYQFMLTDKYCDFCGVPLVTEGEVQ